MSEKVKKTLSTIPTDQWGQKEINKVAARIEADFKLVPQHLRSRAYGVVNAMLNDMTWPNIDHPTIAPPPGISSLVPQLDPRQLDIESRPHKPAAE